MKEKIIGRTYLRGLDGALSPSKGAIERQDENESPSGSESNTDNAAAPASDKVSGTDIRKSQPDVAAFERPYGQAQQDYLRRMAKDLRAKDHDLYENDGK